ncbi:hypothetical protein ACP4OV_000512 [Aristida adscensionis]
MASERGHAATPLAAAPPNCNCAFADLLLPNPVGIDSSDLLLPNPTEQKVSEQKACRGASLDNSKGIRPLKRKRVEAPRIATLEDVHPHTRWSMCVRMHHKFHVERFAVGEKRLSMCYWIQR